MRVFHLIQQAHAALFRASDHAMRTSEGITTAQNAVLLLLTKKDGQKISDLAKQLGMGKSSLTALIQRMEHAALVRRERAPNDERISNIFIEPSGRTIVGKTKSVIKGINAGLLAPFTEKEQETIERFLIHLRENSPAIIAESRQTTKQKKE